MPSKELQQIKEDRERLRREHAAGASGLSVVRALSDSTDQAITAIWERVEGPEKTALIALGGYGRRELSPASDVDLVILHRRGHDVTNPSKSLAYELWDAGLELAYAIQTPREALSLSRQRVDVETAFLDARLITGDERLFDEWLQTARAQTSRSPEKFLSRVREATEARRESAGDAGEELEPNLKDGRGGLRDLVTISWLERVLGAEARATRPDLSSAADFLHRVRNELHFTTGRRTDALLMQHQDRVATSLLGERGDVASEDVLMHTLYRHCRQIAFEADGLLYHREGSGVEPRARSRFASLFRSRPPEKASQSQLEALEALEAPFEEPWAAEIRKAFIEILKQGHKSRAFQALEQTGRLLQILPEWEGIYCLPQRNIYHRYAVDVHTLELVRILSTLGSSSDEMVRRVAIDSQSDEEILILSGLLHDIGKGGIQDHAVRGEELARSALKRFGVGQQEAEEVAWLVRNHLLLSETATRRDIGDERLLGELSETIGSDRRLRLLFLLSIADGIATGPAGWSPWKATLVGQLFTTINHFLENKELFGKDAIQQVHDRIVALKGELSEFDRGQVEQHIDNMPRAWLLSRPVKVLAQHSKMMLTPPPRDELRLEASRQPAQVWEVTIVARDRPGLFSKIAGSLSLHGLNIVGAEIYTREDGVALDIFRVEAVGDEDRRFERVAEDAAKAIKGRLSLDVGLAEKRRDYSGRIAKGKREPPQVVVDNQSSDFYTIVEVHATDRIGLLYTITRALADLELDIHLAKIATYAEDVVDVFYVRDLDSQKVVDSEHLREIERTILYRLAADE